ncbi:MAG: phage terminase large subunit [Thermoguttaceae bacterium]
MLTIDPHLSFPNVGGMPLALVPAAADPEINASLVALHARLRAASRLAAYATYVIGVEPAAHHQLICSHIDDLLADGDDAIDELIILAPPGSAKSTYTSHAFASYFLGRHPDRNVICATHTADLSERWSRKVRNTISSLEHAHVFPDCSLSKDSTAVSRWATSKGGEFLAAGVGGSILGFRADVVVIDDPISGFEQAQSITQLAKVHSWYETDLVTRMKPGAKLVLICQRLSPNDLAGYLIARNALNPTRRQRVLILRMEATADQPDPLNRQPGERLWPEWYTQEMVEDARRDEFKWKTLYQQEPPSDTGSWVSPTEVGFRPSPQDPEVLYGCTDLALSVNTGDYTVHFVLAVDSSGDWDIIDASRERVDPAASARKLTGLCATYTGRLREWLIDDDNASKVFMQLVATEARATGTFVPWKPLPMRGQDKETRAAPLRGMFKRRKVFMPSDAPWTRWLLTEISNFPNALGEGVDDGIDALSLLGRRITAIAPAPSTVVPVAPTPKTWQDVTLNEMWEDKELSLHQRRRIA